jgi:hypothetical protein
MTGIHPLCDSDKNTAWATARVKAKPNAQKKKAVVPKNNRFHSGRPCGIRTCDQRIKSPLLYQLS